MAKPLTNSGRCPHCDTKIVKPYKMDKGLMDSQRTFYAVKSMVIDSSNGRVVARCGHCKNELEMPVMKMPAKLRKSSHAN